MNSRCFTLLVLLLTLGACCTEEYKFEDEVQLTLVEAEFGRIQELGVVADTIRGPFEFRAEGRYLQATALPFVRPAQILMGFSCEETYDRIFDTEAYQLSLDKPVSIAGHSVGAGNNLLPALEDLPPEDASTLTFTSGLAVAFSAGALAAANIPAGDYTFTFTGVLEDGTVFTRTVTTYLDL